MKKIIIGFVCGLVLVLAVIIAVLTTMFVPNKNDWLKVEITHDIRFRVDSWEKRYGVTPIIYADDKILSIGITAANGEDQITPEEAEIIKPQVESIAELTLEKYKWAKEYTVEVNIL